MTLLKNDDGYVDVKKTYASVAILWAFTTVLISVPPSRPLDRVAFSAARAHT
jgi:hypothetical protein